MVTAGTTGVVEKGLREAGTPVADGFVTGPKPVAKNLKRLAGANGSGGVRQLALQSHNGSLALRVGGKQARMVGR
jgi:hypothetical protein